MNRRGCGIAAAFLFFIENYRDYRIETIESIEIIETIESIAMETIDSGRQIG